MNADAQTFPVINRERVPCGHEAVEGAARARRELADSPGATVISVRDGQHLVFVARELLDWHQDERLQRWARTYLPGVTVGIISPISEVIVKEADAGVGDDS